MKDTPMTAEEADLAARIYNTSSDPKTLRDIADLIHGLARKHEDLTLLQVMALSAAAGTLDGVSRALQRKQDEAATGGPITAMDI